MITAEIKVRDLADHHVLRIADERRRRADVAGNGQRNQKRNGIDLFAQQRGADNRRKNVTNDVVIQKSGKTAGDQHQDEQKPRGMSEPRRNAAGHLVVKARQPELRRNDKKSEQQKNRRPVDAGNDIGGGNVAENHHRDGAEQGDADAIKFQAGHVAHGNPEVSDGKNRQNDGLPGEISGHGGNQASHGGQSVFILRAICGWIAIPGGAPCRARDNSSSMISMYRG